MGWSLLDLLYPPLCGGCGWPGSWLCPNCQPLVEFFAEAIPLAATSPLTSLTVGFTYQPPISNLIKDLKYHSARPLAAYFGQLLHQHTRYPLAELVSWVPSSRAHQRQRGYNPAAEIGRHFGRAANLPTAALLCRTRQPVLAQAELNDLATRARNLTAGDFALEPRYHGPPPPSVLLVDDVYTTGATLTACAAALQAAGCSQIHGLVVAHGR